MCGMAKGCFAQTGAVATSRNTAMSTPITSASPRVTRRGADCAMGYGDGVMARSCNQYPAGRARW